MMVYLSCHLGLVFVLVPLAHVVDFPQYFSNERYSMPEWKKNSLPFFSFLLPPFIFQNSIHSREGKTKFG